MKPLTLKTKARLLYGQSDAHNDLYNEDKTDTPVDPAHFNVNLPRSGLLSASTTVGSHECPSHTLSAYFLKGVVPEWDLKDIYYGMMQFMVIQVIGLILIIVFPKIALWLPAYLYGQ